MEYHEEEIYGAIARGWCDERNSGKEMDVDLADAIAIEVLAVVRPLRARVAELEGECERLRGALTILHAEMLADPDTPYGWANRIADTLEGRG